MLDIHENIIRDNGCIALCDNLLSHDLCNIEYLDIGSNDIGNRGITRLSNFIESPNCKLKNLILGSGAKDMYGNKFDSNIGVKLFENVKKSTIELIDLNRITQLGLQSQHPFKVIANWFRIDSSSEKENEDAKIEKGLQSIDKAESRNLALASPHATRTNTEDKKNEHQFQTSENDTQILESNNFSSSTFDYDSEDEEEKYLKILSLAHKKILMKRQDSFNFVDSITSDVIPQNEFQNTKTHNVQIHTIRLGYCSMQDSSAVFIIQNALNSNYFLLRELDFSGNNLIADVCTPLSAYLANPSCRLEILNLSQNNIGKNGIDTLSIGINSNVTLKTLNLNYNHIGNASAKVISDILKQNSSIKELFLEGNDIETSGAQLIAESLHNNTTIEVLKLGKNRILDEGVFSIANSLQNQNILKHLDLNSCGIGDKGAFSLVATIANSQTLRITNLKNNHLTEASGKAFFEMLSKNRDITLIDLRGNQIDHSTQTKIRNLLSQNKVVRKSRKPEILNREVIRLKYCCILLQKAHITLKEEKKAHEHAEYKLIAFKEADRVKKDKLQNQIQATKQNINVEIQTMSEIETKTKISKEEQDKFVIECESRIQWLENTLTDITKSYSTKEEEINTLNHELTTNYNQNAVDLLKSKIANVKKEMNETQKKKQEQSKLIESLKQQLQAFEVEEKET